MTKERHVTIRYSISFKQKVVREIEEEGLTMVAARRKYGIGGGQTIHNWIKHFGKNHLLSKIIKVESKGERDRLKELEAENTKLKLAYADASMHRDVLEIMIGLVNEHYGTDVKKNFGNDVLIKGGKKKGIQ